MLPSSYKGYTDHNNQHTNELQVCKQQQIASGTIFILHSCASFSANITWYTGIYTLMTKRRLQVCKQQQTASGNKLTILPITCLH